MFCKYCGKSITDDAVFCSYCGKKVQDVQEAEETVVFNPPFESDPEFVWNLHEFPQSKLTEDIDFSWEGKKEQKAEENVPAMELEPEKGTIKAAEDKAWEVVSEPVAEATPEPEEIASSEEIFEAIKKESLERESALAPEQEERINKFYTFNKKNEEFQKLLDKEYEKIQNGEQEEQEPVETFDVKPKLELEMEPAFKPDSETIQQVTEETPDEPVIASAAPCAADAAEEPIIFDNDTLAKKFDTKELHKDLIEFALEKVGATGVILAEEETSASDPYAAVLTPKIPETPAEPQSPKAPEWPTKPERPDPPARRGLWRPEEEAPANNYQSSFKPKFLEEFENDIRKEIAEEISSGKPETDQPKDVPFVDPDLQAIKALEALWDADDAPKKEKSFIDDTVETVITEKEPLKPIEVHTFAEEDEEFDQPRKGIAGKAILTVIVVLLALELGVLSVRYLFPDSAAASFVNEKLSFAVNWFGGGDEDADNGKAPVDEPGQPQNGDQAQSPELEPKPQDVQPTQPAEPVTTPEPDKMVLIASQLGYNKNILKIEPNEALKYDPGTAYKENGIKASTPIENNVWYTDNGQVAYYDQAVVAALINFDSSWIDYVNSGDETVLEYTKKGGMAEKNALNFPKKGKIKETFEMLQIGEIRQGNKGFYVWAHEEIKMEEGGKSSDAKYNWIYYLEPVDRKMLVVSYYSF